MSNTDRELATVAYAAVLLVAVLAAFETASFLASSGHILPWHDVTRTLIRLPGHGREAYPPYYRRWLAGDLTMPIAAGAIVAVVLTGSGWILLARYVARQERKAKGARWATGSDLRELYVRKPQPGRLILGRYNDRLIAATDRMSTLVMGPTQLAGKSSRIVIPAVMDWVGSCVATSVKPDLLHATQARRAQLGEIKVFDPLGLTGIPTSRWSPVAEAATWSRARATAALLMQTGWEQDRSDVDKHFRRDAARFLAPLLLAAHYGTEGANTLKDVMRWILTRNNDEMLPALVSCPDEHATRAIENLQATFKADVRYRSNVYATLDAALDPWQEPGVVEATNEPDITAEWLLSGRNTLYLVAPERDQSRLANVFSAIVMQLVGDALVIATRRSEQRLDPALLFALDEAANIARIPNLAETASTGVGHGLILLTVLQDYAQAREKWGADRAASILANHTCKVFCSGINDPDLTDYMRRMLGEEVIEQVSRTQGSGKGSTTTAPHRQALAPPHTIREGDAETAVLVCGRIPPVRITLRPWWKERRLKPPRKKPEKKKPAVQKVGPITRYLS